jgi:hypothetical protein
MMGIKKEAVSKGAAPFFIIKNNINILVAYLNYN